MHEKEFYENLTKYKIKIDMVSKLKVHWVSLLTFFGSLSHSLRTHGKTLLEKALASEE